MCFEEYIGYQCGHRSLGVVRACPLATRGHNFPICKTNATRQFTATTMCAPCERVLHSRWVLIREWEHRWLHERGACSCTVIFPGILTRPRVIGGIQGDNTPYEERAGGPSTEGKQPEIPELYAETVAGNERHVAIRLPSLYAAEWVSDHRKRHQSGQCQCPADFGPFRPDVSEGEMNADERELLRGCREVETKNHKLDERDITDHMTQIGNTFGSFSSVPLGPREQTLGHLTSARTSGAQFPVASNIGSTFYGAGTGPFLTNPMSFKPVAQTYHPSTRAGAASATAPPLPICGLPCGTGPESAESQMPGWDKCELSQGHAGSHRRRRSSFS